MKFMIIPLADFDLAVNASMLSSSSRTQMASTN